MWYTILKKQPLGAKEGISHREVSKKELFCLLAGIHPVGAGAAAVAGSVAAGGVLFVRRTDPDQGPAQHLGLCAGRGAVFL